MRTHPPLFNALTNRLSPHHAANVLARKVAHREGAADLIYEMKRRTRNTPYYPPGWSEPHERDQK